MIFCNVVSHSCLASLSLRVMFLCRMVSETAQYESTERLYPDVRHIDCVRFRGYRGGEINGENGVGIKDKGRGSSSSGSPHVGRRARVGHSWYKAFNTWWGTGEQVRVYVSHHLQVLRAMLKFCSRPFFLRPIVHRRAISDVPPRPLPATKAEAIEKMADDLVTASPKRGLNALCLSLIEVLPLFQITNQGW